MIDRHLNLFYSYNRDNELIENNLTRAFIVSLRILSGQTRNYLLKFIFKEEAVLEPGIDFANAEVALQGYMSKEQASTFNYSYVIAIASDTYVQDEAEVITYASSIPDAWIFDKKWGYCFLIEAKVGQYPLVDTQLHSHAKEWLGLSTVEEIKDHILAVTWLDVLQAIDRLRRCEESGELSLNEQEHYILDNLEEYLGFFNYKLFRGFEFNQLQEPPDFKIIGTELRHNRINLSDYLALNNPPEFILSID